MFKFQMEKEKATAYFPDRLEYFIYKVFIIHKNILIRNTIKISAFNS